MEPNFSEKGSARPNRFLAALEKRWRFLIRKQRGLWFSKVSFLLHGYIVIMVTISKPRHIVHKYEKTLLYLIEVVPLQSSYSLHQQLYK